MPWHAVAHALGKFKDYSFYVSEEEIAGESSSEHKKVYVGEMHHHGGIANIGMCYIVYASEMECDFAKCLTVAQILMNILVFDQLECFIT